MKKNVTIYKGTIRRLHANGVTLQKDGGVTPIVQKDIVTDDSLFYVFMRKFINMEHGVVLPSEEEATYYMENIVKNRENLIQEVMQDPAISDEDRALFFRYLARISSCIYFDPDEVKPYQMVSKEEFKELKKVTKRK